jgi:lysophospholipase L1-like esterase
VRALLPKLLLLAVALVFALVAGELLLRAAGLYGARNMELTHHALVDDPVLDFRTLPNRQWVHNGIPYRTNSRGWRDFEYSFPKPAHVFRILALGDSVLNGHGVRLEDIWAKKLEKQLNPPQGDPRLEVVMLSIGALNTEQEAHLLELEGLAYDPDLVVLGYVLNDPADGSSLRLAQAGKRPMDDFKLMLKKSSLLFWTTRTVKRAYWKLATKAGVEETTSYIERDDFSRLHEKPERWEATRRALRKIRDLCAPRGIDVVVVIFPVFYELAEYPWQTIHDRVARTAIELDFAVLDLLPFYSSLPDEELRLGSGDFVHPNPLGHQVAADALREFLLDRGLVDLSADRVGEPDELPGGGAGLGPGAR